MSNYTFIQKNTFGDNTELNPILAISDKIETLNLFETYDRYGQQVGHYDAGDYSLENSASPASSDCALAIEEKFGVSNVVVQDDAVESFNGIESYEYASFCEDDGDGAEEHNKTVQLILDMNEFIESWKKENENFISVQGFNYWDGHNYRSVITDHEFGLEPTHHVIEENADQMNEEIESCEFLHEGHGKRYYESENFWIVESFWQGDFEIYALYPKSECDLEDIK